MMRLLRALPFLIVSTVMIPANLAAQVTQRITACGSYGDAASDKTYFLDANLVAASGSCITITGTTGSTRVTVDCKDPDDSTLHTITLQGTGEIQAVVTQRPRVTVKNCRSTSGVRFIFDSADYGEVLNSDLGGLDLYYGADFGTFKNSKFGNSTIGTNGNTFERNEFVGTGQHTIDTYMGGTPPDGTGWFKANPNDARYNNIFRDNIIINNDTVQQIGGDTAMYLRVQKGNYFENNIFMATDNSTVIFMRDSANENLFVGNLMYGDVPERSALFFGSGSDAPNPGGFPTEPMNNIFRRNTIRTNTGRAIYMQAPSEGNFYERNLIFSNGSAGNLLYTKGGSSDTYRHNTFYSRTADDYAFQFGQSGAATGWAFFDNIVSYQGAARAAFDWIDGAEGTRLTADHNLYWNRSGSSGNDLTRLKATQTGSLLTLAAWRTATGEDVGSPSPADPKLVDPAAYNLAIAVDSPARGQASDGGDIGAIRYDNPTCTPVWNCGNWSDTCMFSKEFRSCVDLNGCDTAKPGSLATERACAADCNPNWDCSAWSACTAGAKTRTCTDLNACGISGERPPQTWSCGAGGPDTSIPKAPTDLRPR